MANPVKMVGKGTIYVGMGAMFIMAIVGTVSIDLVILMALSKASSRRGNSFLTGYLWGTMFSNRGFEYGDAGIMLLASPFLTGVAIVLSVALGVPEVGVALALGWAVAGAIVAAGMAICVLGEVLGQSADCVSDCVVDDCSRPSPKSMRDYDSASSYGSSMRDLATSPTVAANSRTYYNTARTTTGDTTAQRDVGKEAYRSVYNTEQLPATDSYIQQDQPPRYDEVLFSA